MLYGLDLGKHLAGKKANSFVGRCYWSGIIIHKVSYNAKLERHKINIVAPIENVLLLMILLGLFNGAQADGDFWDLLGIGARGSSVDGHLICGVTVSYLVIEDLKTKAGDICAQVFILEKIAIFLQRTHWAREPKKRHCLAYQKFQWGILGYPLGC